MKTAKECNKLKNRVDCMNKVHELTNKLAPLLQERLKQGFKVKSGGTLYRKDADDVQAIIDGNIVREGVGSRGVRAHFRCDSYNITVEVVDSYPVKYHDDGSGGHSSDYYSTTSYLWNFTDGSATLLGERKTTSYEEMEKAELRLTAIEKMLSDLKSETYPLKRLLGV